MTPPPKLSTPTLASLPIVVQTLFTSTADKLALTHKVIQRRRVLSGSSIALGWLEKPDARLSDLARTAAMIGSPITKQAIAQRLEQASLSTFLRALFEHASSFLFASERSLPMRLLEFEDIDLCDGSIINLPSEHHQRYPGCGAFGQANHAGLKLLTKFSLRSGTLHTELRPAREHDRVTTAACSSKAKTLQLRDLGFFNLRVLAAEDRAGMYWITRVKQGTRIYQRDGRVINNLTVWLQQHACPAGGVDIPILLGAKQRLACRLVATRVPDEVLEARMQKAVLEARKRQRVADHFMRENLLITA